MSWGTGLLVCHLALQAVKSGAKLFLALGDDFHRSNTFRPVLTPLLKPEGTVSCTLTS